jgi:HPt (histidine-containing phosphotransfer) domain-containing protein
MTSSETLKQRVEELWQKHLPLMLLRVDVLQRAIEALHSGPIPDDLKMLAIAEAHKLAGSLGTFGLESVSGSALRIEQLLREETITVEDKENEISQHLHLLRQAIAGR